jgi:hypothetical protein
MIREVLEYNAAYAWAIINLLGLTEKICYKLGLCMHTVNVEGRPCAFNCSELRTTN